MIPFWGNWRKPFHDMLPVSTITMAILFELRQASSTIECSFVFFCGTDLPLMECCSPTTCVQPFGCTSDVQGVASSSFPSWMDCSSTETPLRVWECGIDLLGRRREIQKIWACMTTRHPYDKDQFFFKQKGKTNPTASISSIASQQSNNCRLLFSSKFVPSLNFDSKSMTALIKILLIRIHRYLS